jgi:hypothetical protein
MLLTYGQVERALRRHGLAGFSKRKVQRLAAPVVTVIGDDGREQRVGIISGGKRKGRGYGRGWDWVLPDHDLITIVFVEYALEQTRKQALRGDTIGDAALWAWLWGAPVPLPVVRHYLLHSLDRGEKTITARLHRARRYQDDEPYDLIDRVATKMAYDHPVLKKVGVPVTDLQDGIANTLATLYGLKWSSAQDALDVRMRTVAEPRWTELKQILAGDGSFGIDRFFSDIGPSDITRDRRLFTFKNLRKTYRHCPDDWLQRTQAQFSGQRRFIDSVADALRAGQTVPDTVMALAKDLGALHAMLSHLSPDAVISLHLDGVRSASSGEEGSKVKHE